MHRIKEDTFKPVFVRSFIIIWCLWFLCSLISVMHFFVCSFPLIYQHINAKHKLLLLYMRALHVIHIHCMLCIHHWYTYIDNVSHLSTLTSLQTFIYTQRLQSQIALLIYRKKTYIILCIQT